MGKIRGETGTQPVKLALEHPTKKKKQEPNNVDTGETPVILVEW